MMVRFGVVLVGSVAFIVATGPLAQASPVGGRGAAVDPTATGTSAWVTVSAGTRHSCGIRSDGTAWCWGWNRYGQVGDGTTVRHRLVPVQVGTATDWATVSANGYHTCGTRTDGTAWCWGDNDRGQLGDGTTIASDVPVQVGVAANWTAVAAGASHTCGLRTDGTAWCWGYNWVGQLGDGRHGQDTNSNVPVQVGRGTSWATITAGSNHTCGALVSGAARCWGLNDTGQLGDGGKGYLSDVPVKVRTTADWVSLVGGGYHTCGIRTDGTTWCWGDNSKGQLGVRHDRVRKLPVQVGTSVDWVSLTAGFAHTCGTQVDGTAWCWGYNATGQLGDGTTTTSRTPVQIGAVGDWVNVNAGSNHTCGTLTDGTGWCWGSNTDGQLGDGSYIDSDLPTQIAGGWRSRHSLAPTPDTQQGHSGWSPQVSRWICPVWHHRRGDRVGVGGSTPRWTRCVTVYPALSAATQKVGDPHETETIRVCGSILRGAREGAVQVSAV